MNRREGRYVVILPPDSSASGQLGERQLERAKSKKGGARRRRNARRAVGVGDGGRLHPADG